MPKSHEFHYHRFIGRLIDTEKTEVLQTLLKNLDSVEIAHALLQLKLRHQLLLLGLLDKELASDVLSNIQHSSVLEGIVGQLAPEHLHAIIEVMNRDDAADIVSLLENDKAEALMDKLPSRYREEILTLLQYNEESAGGIMNPYVVSIGRNQTVEQAVRSIQGYVDQQQKLQLFYAVYVVDEFNHLIGTVDVTYLLLAKPHTLISELMNPDVVAVDVDMDQEEVVHVAQEYDLVVVPVIDKYLRLVGRVTIDDLMDVIYEEHQEDLGQITGTGNENVAETSVLRTTRDRLPWLLVGIGGGFLTALVMSTYEPSLAVIPQVTYFIPLIAALGGSVGIQASSIMVRGLATGAIQTSDTLMRLWKELRVGFLNGFICSILLAVMAWYLSQDLVMGILTGTALWIVVCFAGVMGSFIPIFLKRLKIDPALATGPFITTANDIIGISIYLGITFKFKDFITPFFTY